MNVTYTGSGNRSHNINTRLSCTCHSVAPDSSHFGPEKMNHQPQGCIGPGFRDGGFGGYPEERHHQQENRRNVLHSFC